MVVAYKLFTGLVMLHCCIMYEYILAPMQIGAFFLITGQPGRQNRRTPSPLTLNQRGLRAGKTVFANEKNCLTNPV